jgi:hypothetical protein
MSDTDHELAQRIVRRLDHGLSAIDPHVLAQLRSARSTALERMQGEPLSWLAWAGAGTFSVRRHLSPRYLAPIVGMLLALSAMLYWQQQNKIEDPVEIDAKLLASDLPIDALLDKGLDAWLQH